MSAFKFSIPLLKLSRKQALSPIIYRNTKWKTADMKALFSTNYTNTIQICKKYSTDQEPRGSHGCKGTPEATYPYCKTTNYLLSILVRCGAKT